MKMGPKEYQQLVQERATPSPVWRDMAAAFVVGGGICAGGQGLSNLYQYWGLDRQTAGTAVSLTLIVIAAVLTGRADRKATLELTGGRLEVEWSPEDNHVYQTGPAAFVFDGVWPD